MRDLAKQFEAVLETLGAMPRRRLRFRASGLRSPASSLILRPRRGISLLEILISMFVMLFGLMGVAAIFPVGNHYAGRGDQYDRGAALAGSAFAELKARGMLNPAQWIYPAGGPVMNPTTGEFSDLNNATGFGHAYVIDPIGAAETPDIFFPFEGNQGYNPWNPMPAPLTAPALHGSFWPVRRVTFTPPLSNVKLTPPLARTIFQLRDDVSNELPQQSDRPGIQRWTMANNDTPEDPTDDYPLNRAYSGGYTWLATVVPTNLAAHSGMQPKDPRHGSFLYDVSVAVFSRRQAVPTIASERLLAAEMGPGGDLLLYGINGGDAEIDPAMDGIRGGQWIALAGVHPTSGKFLLRWYRLLAVDDETGDVRPLSNPSAAPIRGRNAMIDGPDWPTTATLPVATNLRAILLPGVIGVNTQTVKLNVD